MLIVADDAGTDDGFCLFQDGTELLEAANILAPFEWERPVSFSELCQAEDLEPLGKGRYNWLYADLMLLKVGEAIEIRFDDWKTKTPPYATIRKMAKNLNRQFNYGRHPDGSGWLVKRMG